MATTFAKLPTSDRPLIQDLDMAAAVARELEPLTGKALERAQAAVRRVIGSGVIGPFATVLAAYRDAIREAVGSVKSGGTDG